jgi:NAD(P)-dependent dehydrogenase (short-subunit alcohol dehydrogenase family)
MNPLDGKVALISGAARGIGGETAQLMAKAGAKVVVGDVLDDRGRQTVAAMTAGGAQAEYAHLDVTKEEDWTAAVDLAVSSFGKLDILVNNAGISGSSVGDVDALEGWQKLLTVNAASVFLGTKHAAAAMIPNGRGSIVNISSIMGFIGNAESHPGYAASKGAVRLYTKAAAAKYGPSGIRVNSVHPGYMPPMLNATNAAGRASKIEATPLRRLGEPIEVAYGVLFLASDEASFVTGTELVIDGGYIAQ